MLRVSFSGGPFPFPFRAKYDFSLRLVSSKDVPPFPPRTPPPRHALRSTVVRTRVLSCVRRTGVECQRGTALNERSARLCAPCSVIVLLPKNVHLMFKIFIFAFRFGYHNTTYIVHNTRQTCVYTVRCTYLHTRNFLCTETVQRPCVWTFRPAVPVPVRIRFSEFFPEGRRGTFRVFAPRARIWRFIIRRGKRRSDVRICVRLGVEKKNNENYWY